MTSSSSSIENDPPTPGPDPRTPRASRAALALILVLGFALRLARPELHSFWVDEGFTVTLARSDHLLELLRQDSHPPLSFLLVRAWGDLFGWSDLALRLLPATCSCASLACLAVLARGWLAGERALWAIGLYAVAPLSIWIGHEVRMYAFVELAALLVLLAARRAWRVPSLASRAGLVLSVAFACGLHYYGALVVPVIVAQALLRRLRGALPSRELAATAAAAFLGFAVWLPVFAVLLPRQLASEWPRITQVGWRDLVELPARLVGVDFIALEEHGLAGIGWTLGILAAAGLALALARGLHRWRAPEAEALAAAIVPVAAALVLSALATGGFQPRYLIVAIPGCIASIAAGLLALRPLVLARVTAAALVGCALTMSLLQLSGNRREDYRAVCAEIAERWQEGDRLLVVCCVPRPFRLACVDHYLRERPDILGAVLDHEDYLAGTGRPPSGTRVHVLWREATLCAEPVGRLLSSHAFEELVPARFRIRRGITHVP